MRCWINYSLVRLACCYLHKCKGVPCFSVFTENDTVVFEVLRLGEIKFINLNLATQKCYHWRLSLPWGCPITCVCVCVWEIMRLVRNPKSNVDHLDVEPQHVAMNIDSNITILNYQCSNWLGHEQLYIHHWINRCNYQLTILKMLDSETENAYCWTEGNQMVPSWQ